MARAIIIAFHAIIYISFLKEFIWGVRFMKKYGGKIFELGDDLGNAIDALKIFGIIGIEGTKTFAVKFIEQINSELKRRLLEEGETWFTEDETVSEVDFEDEFHSLFITDYSNTINHGYLYYMVDYSRFDCEERKKAMYEIDELY
jgi:hypothetical protein